LKITLATRRSFAYNLSPGARTNEGGQILIDRAMRSLSHPEVYAVGAHPHGAVHGDHDGSARGGLSGRAAPGETAAAFGLSYVALGLSLGRKDGVVQFLDWNTDRPLKLVFTGKGANRMREFFVRFALWSIRAQRVAPWVFDWPGKRKMRRVAVHGPRPAAPAPAGRESAARSEG
jgi:hypothetical protein